jgi:glycosyltransferase involved in cell wall biosynthesis
MSADQKAEAAALRNVRLEHHPGALEWMDNPWQDVRAAGEWLLSLRDRFHPDVVHLNGYTHAALDWNAPVIVVAHSCVFSWFQGVKRQRPPAEFNQYFKNVKRGLQAADVVVAPSRAMLRELRKHYQAEGDLRVIYNGRNLPAISPGPRGHFVFSAGRVWDEAKNFQLLDAIAPDLHAEVLVAGSSAANHSHSLKHIKLLGQLPPDEMSRYFTGAAVYVSPARYEPFGLCNLEAALHGCPLVLTDLDSFREIWQDNAVYVKPDDANALRSAINSLLHDQVLRQKYGVRACARARQFTAERMAERYLKLYRELAPAAVTFSQPAAAAAAYSQPPERRAPAAEKIASPATATFTVSRRP